MHRWQMAMSHTQQKREQTSLHTHSYRPVKAKKPDKASQSIAVTGGQETTEAEDHSAGWWHWHVAVRLHRVKKATLPITVTVNVKMGDTQRLWSLHSPYHLTSGSLLLRKSNHQKHSTTQSYGLSLNYVSCRIENKLVSGSLSVHLCLWTTALMLNRSLRLYRWLGGRGES